MPRRGRVGGSCIVTKRPIYMLSDGQSNSIGYGTGGRSIDTANRTNAGDADWIPTRVHVWDNAEFQAAADPATDPGERWRDPVSGARPFNTNGDNNAAVWAANAIAADGRDVYLIQTGRGANGIDNWSVGANVSSDGDCLRRGRIVWNAAGLDRPADALIWMQGEADASSFSGYETKHQAMVARYQEVGALRSDAVIVLVSLPPAVTNYASFNTMLSGLADTYEGGATHGRYIDATDLSTEVGEVHWTGASLVTIGERVGAAISDALGL